MTVYLSIYCAQKENYLCKIIIFITNFIFRFCKCRHNNILYTVQLDVKIYIPIEHNVALVINFSFSIKISHNIVRCFKYQMEIFNLLAVIAYLFYKYK